MSRGRPAPRINPSGRPLERPGFEAALSLAIMAGWFAAMIGIIVGARLLGAGDSLVPSLCMAGLAVLCWLGAERVAGGARHLVWPASAFGIAGPMSAGYALALALPELRHGPFQTQVAVISLVCSLGMIPFLFRFRLPGLVSPIITFALVGLFLGLYGTDMERLRAVEGFSARGILAALITSPWVSALAAGLAAGALVLARRLDLGSDNFGLAAARPLHLVGAGVLALVAGRAAGPLPGPWDGAALGALWLLAIAWTLRVNRLAVMFAAHLALMKPVAMALWSGGAAAFDLERWTVIIAAVIWFDLLTWPFLHLLSQRLGWTLGPGGRVPPAHPGALWRYWPYATAEDLARWAERRAARRARRRAAARPHPPPAGADPAPRAGGAGERRGLSEPGDAP